MASNNLLTIQHMHHSDKQNVNKVILMIINTGLQELFIY